MFIEKIMGLVYRVIDSLSGSEKRKSNKPEAEKSINSESSEEPRATVLTEIVSVKTVKPKAKDKAPKTKTPAVPVKSEPKKKARKSSEAPLKPLERVTVTKKMSSVRSGKKISSTFAAQMLTELKNKKMKVVSEAAEINGKKSLAWVVWALGVADKTKMQEGISIHDVSSLLYHAAKIEIYPINVSRMVHDNDQYIRQVSQDKKTKRYLLTDEGRALVSALPLADLVA